MGSRKPPARRLEKERKVLPSFGRSCRTSASVPPVILVAIPRCIERARRSNHLHLQDSGECDETAGWGIAKCKADSSGGGWRISSAGRPNWLGFSDQGASKTMLFGTAISPYGRSGSRA